MRTIVPVAVLALSSMFADSLAAQGGRGRGRAEEIQNRVGAYFTDAKAAEGDKARDLAASDFVRAAASAGQPAVLYLFDGGDDKDVREQFERTLFGTDEIGIALRCFHCARIDLAQAEELKSSYGKQAPAIVAFDKDGKLTDTLAMSGYKASGTGLEKLLEKAAQGTKPPLATFTKEYAGLVRDLEQALAKKKAAQEKLAKAGADKAKKAEADKDLEAAEAGVKRLLEREEQLLGKVQIVERPTGAQRLGAPSWGGGGGGRRGSGGGGGGGGASGAGGGRSGG